MQKQASKSSAQLVALLQQMTQKVAVKPPQKPSAVLGEDGTWASSYGFELPRDELIAIKLLQGESRLSAAKLLDLAPPTVYTVVQTEQFINAFHKMQAELREDALSQKDRIAQLASQGLDRIANILYNSEDADLVGKMSLAMVDRAGHAIRQHMQVDKTVIHIDAEQGECIETAFRELREVAQEVEDFSSPKVLAGGQE